MQMHNLIGMTGAVLVLIPYFLIQLGRLSSKDLSYSLFNLIGSVLIMYSLSVDWNLASFLIELVWVAVSVYGIYAWLKKNRGLQ